MRTPIAALLVLSLGVSPAMAQQHQHRATPDGSNPADMAAAAPCGMRMGMMQGMMGMMGGHDMKMPGHLVMQRTMRLAPNVILNHKDALELTASQVIQLEELSQGPSMGHAMPMTTGKQAEAELTRAFEAESPDTLAVRKAAQEVFALHATQQARRVAIASAVRGILTATQREKVMLLSPCPMGQGGGMMMRQGGTDSPMRQ